ncbi:CB1 cannabinoid receptor-interacting protein 1-like [Uloborus diversus]|uniref:CB1 cannabinoid receptor-interacting protein 1-like n=1 Tax=Uloborus diversus TaxID=327109 RepID=UPI0024092EC3|nr:CB1 cannabinoid receptor-interacting protein 1-like [Uloborus diversus]
MNKTETKFSLSLTIKRDDTNALVFYKQDGQRFDNDNTIKMKVQTSYKFILAFKPQQKINTAFLKGEELEIVEDEKETGASKYSLKWNSNNVPVTKKNRRFNFPLIMDVQNVGTLELTLQFKFYPADDTSHSAWGKNLHFIEYDCLHKPGKSFVEILSQIYR